METLLHTVLLFFLLFTFHGQTSAVKKSYIVYLGEHSDNSKEASPLQEEQVRDFHYEFLGSLFGSKDKAKDAIFHSCTRHINAFAAYLEEEEALEISKHSEVTSVFPNKVRELQTTRAWEFLGLEKDGYISNESIWKKSKFGEDIIIGNLDTGVWPYSKSFNDKGMGPVPSKWKGMCQRGQNGEVVIHCNRKLIGAKYFNAGYRMESGNLTSSDYSALDYDGHGTHTLSTAAGGFVSKASVFGYGQGTAKGGSPNARVAAYKVCWGEEGYCHDVDILAGFDSAIGDGVDILSVSLGGSPSDYFSDSIAIGSFHAVKRGITVLCSAGNGGPHPETVTNVAPWIITVGASTIDRQFPSYAFLGDGNRLQGQSLSSASLRKKYYPLISSADARSSNSTKEQAMYCESGSLDATNVKGKIVACIISDDQYSVTTGEIVRRAGGVGMILVNDKKTGEWICADRHIVPATHISYSDGLILFSYIKSEMSPTAYISKPTTHLGTQPAPVMADFSSKGPNTINPEFLKPDITAPGVSIIAAYTGATGPSSLPSDRRRVLFNSLSGTSMSCPMAAGIAGLLKTLYPDWSPAAIKSAIMTTAGVIDNRRAPILNASFVTATPFDYGSGHINPNLAMDPGLIYDTTMEDYNSFLCAIGYNSTLRREFSGASYSGPSKLPKTTDLNYPSITIPKLNGTTTVTRRVRNVGSSSAKYTVRVKSPRGVSVSVKPTVLAFEKIGEEKSFKVTFKALRKSSGYVFGSMIWSDGVHSVRSPLVVELI